MRRLLRVSVFACLAAFGLQAAGTVTQTLAQLSGAGTVGNQRPIVYVLTASWIADSAAATIPATILQRTAATLGNTDGLFLLSVQTVPGSPAPTALYSVTITDANSRDILGGTCVARSATLAEVCTPPTVAPALNGSLTLNITANAVNSAQGQVILYLSTTPTPPAGPQFANLARMPTSVTTTARNSTGAMVTENGSRFSVVASGSGTQASASIAAEAGVRHVATGICFSAVSSGAVTASTVNVFLRDGASGAGTGLLSFSLALPTAAGANIQEVPSFCTGPLNIVGTTNTAMTAEFSAANAAVIETINLIGYNVN